MPGLDIAEQKSWQNYLDSTLRLYATLNRQLTEAHQLSLFDVRVLDMLDNAPAGCVRMGDLAEELVSLPSRVTRQIRRLEGQGLVRARRVRRTAGGVAAITDDGRAAARQAMVTYGQGVRTHFLAQLSRPQIAAMGENCRRISAALKRAEPGDDAARDGWAGRGGRSGPATLVGGGVAERPNALALKARDG